MSNEETTGETRERLKERLGHMIINPSGSIRSSLKRPAFQIAQQLVDQYLDNETIESITVLESAEERDKKSEEVCNGIVEDIMSFIKHLESTTRGNEGWYQRVTIQEFMEYME